MYLLMKLCFTQTSLAARDFSGDPGTKELKNITKTFQFQATGLTEQDPISDSILKASMNICSP